jgi:hypothetical protein
VQNKTIVNPCKIEPLLAQVLHILFSMSRFTFLLLLLITARSICQTPQCEWLNSIKTHENNWAGHTVCDRNGDLIVSGNVSGPILIGSNALPGTSASFDPVFTKYSPTGSVIWAKRFTGRQYDYTLGDISVDSKNCIYVSGRFGSSNFIAGSYTLQNSDTNTYSAYFAKLDVNGETVWAKAVGSGNNNGCLGTVTDSDDNVLVHGFFTNSLTVEGNILLTSPSYGVFFNKYNAGGKLMWAKKATAGGNGGGISGTADNEGCFYICGWYMDSIRFDNVILKAQQGWESFVVKYDANGNVAWANNIGGPLHEYAEGINFDGKDHIYVAGHFIGTVKCGTVALNATSFNMHAFILRIDKSGQLVTGNSWNADGQVSARSVVCMDENRIVVGGDFYGVYMNYGALSINDGTLQPHDNRSFLLVMDSAFTGNEIAGADCGRSQRLYSISKISGTELCGTGDYGDCMTFGTGSVSGYPNNVDQFVGKFILGQKPLAIAESQEQLNAFLFPNPANEKVHIKSPLLLNTGAHVAIGNSLGECCMSAESVLKDEMIFDIGSLKDGIYFVTIGTREKNVTQKLMISKR